MDSVRRSCEIFSLKNVAPTIRPTIRQRGYIMGTVSCGGHLLKSMKICDRQCRSFSTAAPCNFTLIGLVVVNMLT